jgi:hypothetical protein
MRNNENERIENDDYSSQIRSLRLILGKNYRPISTTTFASISGIAEVSIRAVEAGRRKLNEQDRERITIYLGAQWDETLHNWVCSQNSKIPYTRKQYEAFNLQSLITSEQVKNKQAIFIKELNNLLGNLDPRDGYIALAQLQRMLHQNTDHKKP